MGALERLNAYQSEEFKSWLNRCLRQQYDSNSETHYWVHNFRELGILFGDCESNVDSLHKLFDKLSVPAQEAFRESVYLLITQARVNDFPKKAMQDLLSLALLVKATKALDILESVIIDGAWGKKHRLLIYDCIGIMMSLGYPTEKLRKKHGFR